MDEDQNTIQQKTSIDKVKTNKTSVLDKEITINDTYVSDLESSEITNDQPKLKPEFEDENHVNSKPSQKDSSEEIKTSKPAQTSLSDLEPASLSEAHTAEDDMLEIPAFLRRQAN